LSPVAIAVAKRALNFALEHDLATSLDYEAQLQAVAGNSEDHREGVDAFRAKRPPAFPGR
jgi:2-(1,2-epoxy-1,2-dihydrophenyl)acetyl-CoA isomerase